MALILRITCSDFYGTAFAFGWSVIRLLGLILAVRLGLGSLLGGLGYKAVSYTHLRKLPQAHK